MDTWPSVSLIITCYNEKACLRETLESIIASDYDISRVEMIVVDGMSSDGTRDIIADFCRRYNFIRMLDNPRRLKPSGNNLGIQAASGEYVLIMDGHTVYPPDYIKKVIAGSIETGSANYGGIVEVVPREDNVLGQTLAAINSHPFGVGNAHYRIGAHQRSHASRVRPVDTVPFGCFKRELFVRIGFFNPDLPRAEDRDLNTRIRNAGGSIILDTSIKCRYFIRSRLQEYLPWIKENGFWVFYADRYTNTKFRSWRNYTAMLFLLYCCSLLPAYLVLPRPLFMAWLSLLIIYMLLDLFFSIRIGIRNRHPLSGLLAIFLFILTHFTYGFGSLAGIVKLLADRRTDRLASLSGAGGRDRP